MNTQTSRLFAHYNTDKIARFFAWMILATMLLAFVVAGFNSAHAQTPINPGEPTAIECRITVKVPAPIVRATIPLAPGTPWDASRSPFRLSDGEALPTQWEKVATWPDGTVRIAELLAYDATPSTTYTVERVSVRDGRAKPGPWARNWINEPPTVVLDAVVVPLTWSSASHRYGSVAITRRFFGRNVLGWVTTWTGLDVVTLDLVLHNGETDRPDLFFDELIVAGAGSFESVWPEPLASPLPSGALELLGYRSDGYARSLVQRGSSTWSLVLHDGSKAQLARAMADGAGWGVADSWTRVDAFGSAALRLPDLAYRASQLGAGLATEWRTFRDAIASGSPVGLTSGGVGRVGWQHPWNPKDGGTTGGGGRHQWFGVELAASGEPAGLSLYAARLAAIMDRSAVLALQPNGMPIPLESMLDSAGKPRGNWTSSAADARFDGKTDGAFGWAALQSQNAGQRTPPELATFKMPIAGGGNGAAFEPIDFQHWDRAMQDAEALVQLSNSPLAAWWIRCNAETWRASIFSSNRLGGALSAARSRPAWGSPFGRAHGHGMRFASFAYAISDDPWRARWTPYLDGCAELLLTAQTPTGLYKRDGSSKELKAAPFLDAYDLTKGTEEALLANGLLGIARSTGLRSAALVESVDRWTRDGLWSYLWGAGSTGSSPSDYVALAPRGAAPYTSGVGITRKNADREEIASPLGSAMLLRALAGLPYAPEQIAATQRWCGSTTPLTWMRNQTPYKLKLDDCAPLHAAMEIQ